MSVIVVKDEPGCNCCQGGCCSAIVGLMWLAFCAYAFISIIHAFVR